MNAKRLIHAHRIHAPSARVVVIALVLVLLMVLLASVSDTSWGGRLPCGSCLASQIIDAIGPSIDTPSPFGF